MKLGLVYLNNNSGSFPPLGLTSIATYLKQEMHFHNSRIIDINFENVYETIKRSNFDLIGISAMTIEYNEAIRLAQWTKEELDIPVIIGGVHISTLHQSLKNCFDLGVIGEGEQTMLELVQLFEKKGEFTEQNCKEIPGLIFRRGNHIITTKRRPPILPLDKIPVPDREFQDRRYLRRRPLETWSEFGVETSILTSRGCPYKCVFCSTTQFWQKLRFHSPEHVISEVKYLVDNYKVDHIQIWDDLFTIHKKRLKKIAIGLREEGIVDEVKFNCQARADSIDDELCRILKSMNVELLIFGFESGSERILNYLKRGTVSVKDNQNAIRLCRKHGLRVQGSVIFGSPGETLHDMEMTLNFIDFAKQNGVERIWSFVMTPFPATEVWQIAKTRGKVSDDMNWDLLSHQNVDDPLLLDDNLNIEDFKRIFFKSRDKQTYFKIKKAFCFLRNSSIETFKIALFHPQFIKRELSRLLTKRGF